MIKLFYNKFILLILFAVFISVSTIKPLYSQSSIAVLDVSKLLKESKASLSIQEQVKKLAKSINEDSKKNAKEIQKKEEELLRQKRTLTPEAFSDRKNAFEKIVIDFNKKRDAKRKALQSAEREAITKIEDATESIVKSISTEKNIDVVIRKAAIILSEPTTDITQDVIDKLNKQLSTIDVKVAQ